MKESIKIPPELVYPVRKIEAPGGYRTNSYNSHAIIVDTPSGGLKVNDCSDEYRLIRNSAILNPLIEGLSKDHKIHVSGRSWNDAVFNMRVAVETGPGITIVDKLYPMIDILNSYNGRIQCNVNMGVFRGFCANGMVVPTEMQLVKNFSHTPSNEEELAVKKILQMFEGFCTNFGEVSESYDDLKISRVFNLQRRVDEVIEATNFPSKFAEEVMDRVNLEMAALNSKCNDWLVYNAFNYQLNHNDEMVWEPKKKNKADQEVLDFLLAN